MKKIIVVALLFLCWRKLNAQGCSCCEASAGGFSSQALNDDVVLQTKNAWLMDVAYDYRLFKPYTSNTLKKMFESL